MSTWRGFRRLLQTIPSFQPRAREEVEAFQARCLRRVIRHAYENVPYYRRLFDEKGIDPREIRSTRDLSDVPISSRSDLQSQPPQDLVSRGVDPDKLIELKTSASDKPLIVRRTWLEQTLLHGFLLRANRHFGLRVHDRMAALSFMGPPHPRDRKALGKALQSLGVYRVTRISAGLDPEDLLTSLRELQPDVVTGYPSVLSHIAGFLGERDHGAIQPRFLMVGAEVLTPHHRNRITEGFRAPVFDVYSSSEFHVIGWECRNTGELHTCDDSVIVEVISGGRPASPGEQGEVVGTALHSYAMPMIRYRLDDVVTRGSDRCSCGEPYSTIREVQGRVTAYVKLPNGGTIHVAVLDPPIRDQVPPWIAQYQFVQERLDLVVLQVVPAVPPPPGRLEEMRHALSSLLGQEMEAEIRLVPEIPVPRSGKHQFFRSNL